VTSFVGEACTTSSGETGDTGDSSRSDALSGDNMADRSEDFSDCEWSGRKRSSSGSAVELSYGSATLETGVATGVRVVRGTFFIRKQKYGGDPKKSTF